MSIFKAIDNIETGRSYNAISTKQHMKELPSREYDFLYTELKYKAAFHYVDRDLQYNLVMKIDNEKQIEEVVKNRKTINVTRSSDGPVIEMNIEGLNKPFTFMFNLWNNDSLYNLKILTETREAKMHFVLYNQGKLTKIFSAMLNIDDRIFDRLSYIVKLSFNGCYPYIEYHEEPFIDTKCLGVIYGESLLDEVVSIIDNLQKWGSNDCFTVFIEYADSWKIAFKGRITNFNYIKNELQKKFNIIGEVEPADSGKPFIKYDRGMIYFYKTRFSENIE